VYGIIALGAGLENVFPPIPADTFVLLGALLAAAGRASPRLVFFWTWAANVAGAMGIYALSWRHGNRFFATPIGERLLNARQLTLIGQFYARWGVPAIFISRFLPGLRALVPVFAGVAQVPPSRVLLPLAIASGLWYGFLVYIGAYAGRNIETILGWLNRTSTILLLTALLAGAALAVWWWRTRHR
jgi:membrane protein DedA with SNARE-associated domain